MNGSLILLRWEIRNFLQSRILLFWNFLFPVLIFVTLSAAFGGPTSLGRVAVSIVDKEQSSASAAYLGALRSAFDHNGAVAASFVINGAAPRSRDIILQIPSGFGPALGRVGTANVIVVYDGRGSVAQRTAAEIIRAATNQFELYSLEKGAPVNVVLVDRSGGGTVIGYEGYLATGIVVMTLLSTCTIGLMIPLVIRRENNILRTFQCLPLRREALMFAFVVSRVLIGIIFTAMFLSIVPLFYHLQLSLDVAAAARVLLLVVIGSVIFCLIGLAAAGRLRSVVIANAAANLLYFPLTFLGNLMIPVAGFAEPVRNVLSFSPGMSLVTALRGVVFDRATLGDEWQHLAVLSCWGLLAGALIKRFFVWDRAH